MGFPDMTFRVELPQVVRKELELLYGQLQGFLTGAGFNSNGSFGTLRGDTVSADAFVSDAASNTYVPAWSSAGTQPSLGDGTITGFWQQIGSTVYFEVRLTMGTTTTFGTGVYAFSLPMPSARGLTVVGSALLFDLATATYLGTAFSTSGGTEFNIFADASVVDPAVPFTWATGDVITVTGSYAVA